MSKANSFLTEKGYDTESDEEIQNGEGDSVANKVMAIEHNLVF